MNIVIKKWKIKYHTQFGSSLSLENWFESRNHVQIKSIAKEMALLERCGNTLRLPHSKALGKGLFELRERTYGYRLYYAFSRGNIILLNAGDKRTQEKDIKLAYKRLSLMKEKEHVI